MMRTRGTFCCVWVRGGKRSCLLGFICVCKKKIYLFDICYLVLIEPLGLISSPNKWFTMLAVCVMVASTILVPLHWWRGHRWSRRGFSVKLRHNLAAAEDCRGNIAAGWSPASTVQITPQKYSQIYLFYNSQWRQALSPLSVGGRVKFVVYLSLCRV